MLCVASSHFGSAEKQFRYPLAYANQRPLSATWTVTGCGAFVVGTSGRVKITGITMGKIVDYGVRDSMNMGACMAPAAADTIAQNLQDFGRTPEDYDQIISRDGAMTLASIVYEETKRKDEMPVVAGVYINRLKRGMPLQADPTVKFAVGDFSIKRVLHTHLAVR